MLPLEAMATAGFEEVVYGHDADTGLRAIIAVHSTRLGPALGGARFYPYPDETAALVDVLRLAKGMTYKAAAAGLALGGGKAVILGDPGRAKTAELLRSYGRLVDSLSGRYLTAEDVGTTQDDMDLIREVTTAVTGTNPDRGGSGDPSEATAEGVRCALRAVVGSDDLSGLRVVIAGVGKVGSGLCRRLVADGATVIVADTDPARVATLRAEWGVAEVAAAEAHRTPCDVFSPCALGAVLNALSIPELSCRAVVGAANNQLAEPEDAERLDAAGITYAPDFVVNAGGIINIAEELAPAGYDRDRALQQVARIGDTVRRVLDAAATEGTTTALAAERLAERRIATAGGPPLRSFPAGLGLPLRRSDPS